MLDIDSELLFVGDSGTTDASRPSKRRGVELAAQYDIGSRLSVDGEYAWSRARYADADPAGDHIPGSVEAVGSLGITLTEWKKFFGELRLRRLGARPLVEDGSVRADGSQLVNVRAGYALTPRLSVNVDLFNVLDADVSDIEYFYESRLPGEAAPGVSDVHFHPVEPRSIRVSLRSAF